MSCKVKSGSLIAKAKLLVQSENLVICQLCNLYFKTKVRLFIAKIQQLPKKVRRRLTPVSEPLF